MKSDFGGRRDEWGNSPGGDRMSVAELKSVPNVAGVNRSIKDFGIGKRANGGNNPSTRERDRICSRSDGNEAA